MLPAMWLPLQAGVRASVPSLVMQSGAFNKGLLLLLMVGADGGDEGSRSHHVARDEIAPRRGAGNDDVAFRDGLAEIRNRRRSFQLRSFFRILVVGKNAFRAAHRQQGRELGARLRAAAADQQRRARFP